MKMPRDRFDAPEYVVGEPIMPELIRLNPDYVTPDILEQIREGNEYPMIVRGLLHDYSKLKIVNEFGKNRVIDNGFSTEMVSAITAERADEMNMKAIQKHWDSGNPGSSWVPHMGSEYKKRHLGNASRVCIGFFERAVRRVRGLPNDIWRYQAPGIDNEETIKV